MNAGHPDQMLQGDLEAEMAVIACCIIDGLDQRERTIDKCRAEQLSAAAFSDAKLQTVYRTIMAMDDAKTPVAIAALAAELKTQPQFAAENVHSFLSQLTSQVQTTAEAGHFVSKVRDTYGLRQLAKLARNAQERCQRPGGKPITSLLEELQTDLSALAVAVTPTKLRHKPFTVWAPSALLRYVPRQNQNLLGAGYLGRGQIAAFIGQGGIGKSRLCLALALAQITGKDWCGIPTFGPAVKWLLIGNENTPARQKADLEKMLLSLTDAQREAAEANLREHVMDGFEDSVLGLEDPDVQGRLRQTILEHNPGAIILDPLSALQIGDESKTQDMTQTLRVLARVVRSVAPDAAILIVQHARTGTANVRKAVGYDAADFGRGSKVLYSAARCVINLAPASEDNSNQLVLSCAKANDSEKFTTRGILFDPETFGYSVDSDFDLEAWKDDVEGKRKPGGSMANVRDVVEIVRGGIHKAKAITEALTEIGASTRTAQRLLHLAHTQGYVTPTIPRGSWTITDKAMKIK